MIHSLIPAFKKFSWETMGIRLREKLVRLWQMVVFLFLIPGLRGEEGMIIGDSGKFFILIPIKPHHPLPFLTE